MTRAEELAWAGGVLEAKGYAKYQTRGSTLRLTDTRPQLLHRFCEIVGVGKVISDDYVGPLSKLPNSRWELYRRSDIDALVEELTPFLSDEARDRFSCKVTA